MDERRDDHRTEGGPLAAGQGGEGVVSSGKAYGARDRFSWITLLWAGPLLLCALLFAASNTEVGRDQVRRLVQSQVTALLQEAELTIGHLDGNLLTGLDARDILIASPAGHEFMGIGRLRLRYRLWSILRSEISLGAVHLDSVRVQATQRADSTWDWAALLAPSDDESTWTVRIDTLSTRHVTAEAVFQFHPGTSSLYVHDLELTGSGFELQPDSDLGVGMLRLQSAFQPPVRSDTVHVTLAAGYRDGLVRVDTLGLRSDRSRVAGGGMLQLPASLSAADHGQTVDTKRTRADTTTFTLKAAPLSLSDVAPFVPMLRVGSQVEADLDLVQQASFLQLSSQLRHPGEGRVSARLAWEQRDSGSHVSVQAEAARFDVDQLLGGTLDTSPVDATLFLDLRGPTADSLTGQGAMRVEGMMINGRAIGASDLVLSARSGFAEATVQASIMDAVLDARLSGRWLDPVPSVSLEGDIRDLDLASWTGSEGPSSRLAASFSGATLGLDPPSMRSDLTLEIRPSRIGAMDSLTAAAQVSLLSGELAWSAHARLADGSLRSEGAMDLSGDLLLRPSSMRLDGVDVAALLRDDDTAGLPTRASAVLTAEATLEHWRTGKGRLRLETDATRWGAFRLARSTTDVIWEAGQGSVEMALVPTDTSSIVLALDLEAPDGQLHVDSRHLSWHQLDVRSLTTLDLPEGMLQGKGAVRMAFEGADLRSMNLSLQAQPSRWGVQAIPEANVSILADTDKVEATVEGAFSGPGQSGGSDWNLAALFQHGQSAPTVQIDLGFDALDPSAFAGRSDPGTALTGRARVTGKVPGAMPTGDIERGTIELDLSPSRLRGEPLARARLEGVLQDSTLTADAAFTLADGEFTSNVLVRPFDALPAFRAEGSVSRLNILPLLGRTDLDSDVNLNWEISGTSFDPAAAEWQVVLDGEESRIDSLEVRALEVSASWNGAVLDIDRLSSQINAGTLQASGRLNLAPDSSDAYSDLTATWLVEDIHTLGPLLGLETLALPRGNVDLQIYGLPGQLDAQLRVSLSDVTVGDVRLFAIDASAWMLLDRTFLPVSTTATLDMGYAAFPGLALQSSSLQIDQQGEIFSATAQTSVDSDNSLAISAQVNPFADRPEGILSRLDLVLGGAPFVLRRPVSLVIDEGWQMSPLEIRAADQQLSLAGRFSDQDGYAVRLDMASLDMAPFGPFVELPDLQGRIGGHLVLSGHADALEVDSQLDIEVTRQDEPLAVLRTDLASTSEGLRIDATAHIPGSDEVTVQGVLPVFASLGSADRERADRSADLNLVLQSDGGSIRWLNPFLDPTVMSDLEGLLTMEITVRGTIESPRLAGFLHLDGTRFQLPEYGVTYRMDRFRSSLQGVSLSVEEARLRSGGGTVDISGQVDFASLTNSSFDLRAQLDRFRAVRNEELHTTLSGSLQLTGRTTRPELSGQLTTSNTSFWPTETAGGDLRQFPLSFEDEVMLVENFGYQTVVADTLSDAIWRGLAMEVSIEIERDTWIRQRVNPEMAIELSGRIDVQKNRGEEDMNIFRRIEVLPDRSTIKQFGRNFRIVEGLAQFNGPIEEMVLQVEAEYEVPSRLNPGQPEVVITLRLDGRLDDLAFHLSSEPAMENTDIVSYIATGRPASESLQFSDSSVNNQVLVGLAASQIAGLVEGVASQSLGLDVVSIEQDGLKGTRLTAGKYMTPRLFVGVTQPFSFSSGSGVVVDEERELTLEYEWLDYLLLQLLADASDSPVRVNLAGRYSY